MITYTAQEVTSKLEKYKGGTRRGAHCIFFKLNKTTGLKVYPSKEEASGARAYQAKAAKHSLAPKAGKLIKIDLRKITNKRLVTRINLHTHFRCSQSTTIWGFLTELVKVGGFRYNSKPIIDLIRKLLKIDIEVYDTHAGNYGYKNKKKPLWIDFDIYFTGN